MVKSRVTYQGDLRCEATHEPSGSRIHTDAPKDNQGKGESFSPTDLVATALGSCILTVMGIVADRRGIDLSGAYAEVDKHMIADPVRRIGRLNVQIVVPGSVTPEDQKILERAAHTCPVHKSLHPDIDTPIVFEWG